MPENDRTLSEQELNDLMDLPLNEIVKLPEETQTVVWRELVKSLAPILQELKQQMKQQISPAYNTIKKSILNKINTDDFIAAFKQYSLMSPYIDAEYKENREKYETADALTLMAAAARRARQDGLAIPLLPIEKEYLEAHPEAAKEYTELTQGSRSKSMQGAHERRNKAQETGALALNYNQYLPTIAEKAIGFDYFTAKVIKQLPTEISELALDKETGELSLYDMNNDGKTLKDRLKEIDRIHTGFLMWLFGLAVENSDLRVTNSRNPILPIYVPAILEAIGKDPRPTSKKRTTDKRTIQEMRRDAFMEFLKPLLNFVALFGGSLFQIVGLNEYNIESETVYLTIPYMLKLVEKVKLSEPDAAIVKIFSAKIVTENPAAVEVANRIAIGLIERGVTVPDTKIHDVTGDKKPLRKKITTTSANGEKIVTETTYAQEPITTITKETLDKNGNQITITKPLKKKNEPIFTYRVKFSTLIEECPNLKNELEHIKNAPIDPEAKIKKSAQINKKLKDVFTAAVNIIMQKSLAPDYYNGLTITTNDFAEFKAPTSSTIKTDKLIVRHKGQKA